MTTLSIATLREMVATITGVEWPLILADQRADPLVRARHLLMWAARTYTGRTLPEIGRIMHRDHTSVLYGVRKIEAEIDTGQVGADLAALIDAISVAIAGMDQARIGDEPDLDPLDIARSALASIRTTMHLPVEHIQVMAAYVVAMAAAALDVPEPASTAPIERRIEVVKVRPETPTPIVKAAQDVVVAHLLWVESTSIREEQHQAGVLGRRMADLSVALDAAGTPAKRPAPVFKTSSKAL